MTGSSVAPVRIPDSQPDLLPPDGDPAGVDALARLLFRTASRYEDFADVARGARPAGVWSGRAYESYLEATRRAAGEHDRLAVAVRRVARTCAAASDTLTELAGLYRGQIADKRGCDARRTHLVADAAGDPPDSRADLAERARALDRDYAALVEDHRRLHQRQADTEQLLVRAFTGTTTLAQILSGRADPVAHDSLLLPGAPGPGADPAGVRAWWGRLTDAQRAGVLAAYPRLIGAAAGLSARIRDRANRVTLENYLTELRQKERDGTLSAFDRRELATARATRRGLQRLDEALDPVTGDRPGGLLWLFDPSDYDGDGRVALGIGDIDTAADVAVRVPGVGNDGSDVDDLARDALAVWVAARRSGDGSSLASLAWLGYDAPDDLADGAAYTLDRAADGGAALTTDLAGLLAGRADDPHLTVIGHSYGSAVAGQALAGPGATGVDDVVLVGSPGVGVDHAAELGLGAQHVWVGAADEDIVSHTGLLGPDPAGADFAALRFGAEDASDDGLWDVAHHHAYFDDGAESLANLAHVVDGSTGEVALTEPRAP